jgi:solute carrier family 8 (sodium/calcium exchanger)
MFFFLGVAIVSDVFMGAIEVITSKKVRTKDPKTGRYITTMLWNPTVANLTLMALGSSAPEILLSVIELFSQNMFSGDLGPSTIVGSAAFNLLCISAVCVMAIPSPEVRLIKDMEVYAVTAFFSIFAYVWLIVILTWHSPNIIDIGEGIITFLFFPILVTFAFMADKGYFSTDGAIQTLRGKHHSELTMEELSALELKIRQAHGGNLSDEELLKLLHKENEAPISRAAYRVAAVRALSGGRKVEAVKQGQQASFNDVVPALGAGPDTTVRSGILIPTFEFKAAKYTVLESAGHISIPVTRGGDTAIYAAVAYETREGSAKKTQDYIHVEGRLEFAAGETEKNIEIKIIDDTAFEQDEDFFVDLKVLDAFAVSLGALTTARVIIIDDDEPGVLGFEKDQVKVEEKNEDQMIALVVERRMGGTGVISCLYRTEEDTALKDKDYEAAAGEITFEPGQMYAKIEIKIKANGRFESTEMFHVILSDPKNGAKLDTTTDSKREECICSVIIEADTQRKQKVERLMSGLRVNWDKAKIGQGNWKSKFQDALYVNGGDDDDEDGEPKEITVSDYMMHGLTLPWKLIFSTIPPTDFCGGWVCFISSLIAIGVVTAFIGDIAALFGCSLGTASSPFPNSLTAITFVALGTSLPDTFASKSAAMQDPYADACIGNVTGSNSVNVFLGLGLPWMMGAFYWSGGRNTAWAEKYVCAGKGDWLGGLDSSTSTGAAFVVEAGSLSYSVTVFSCCAVAALALLYIRRKTPSIGGELGGPKELKWATSAFLVMLWFVYIAMSAIKVLAV